MLVRRKCFSIAGYSMCSDANPALHPKGAIGGCRLHAQMFEFVPDGYVCRTHGSWVLKLSLLKRSRREFANSPRGENL